MTKAAKVTESRVSASGQGRGAGQSPAPVTLTIPVPPSVNQLFRNLPGKGRVKTRAYNDWRSYAVTMIRSQRVKPIAGRVVMIIGVERTSLASDIDNRIKAILDALVDAKVISDDSQVTAFCAAWIPPANGLAHVQILPASRLGINFHPSPDGASGGWYVSAPQPSGEDHGLEP